MEAARQEISQRFGIERWTVFDGAEVCAGCRFLDGRVFFAFEGPQPTLHVGCRCGRLPVDISGMSGVALIRLVLKARANGRQARFLEVEARRLSQDERVDRQLEELAARDPRYVPIQEVRARERRERRVSGGR
jgi:hypothetical protein